VAGVRRQFHGAWPDLDLRRAQLSEFFRRPFWTASAFHRSPGAAVSMLRGIVDSILPLLAGGTLLILACCLAATGIRRFYGQDCRGA